MADTWKIHVGAIGVRGATITIEAWVRFWPDGVDSGTTPPTSEWDVRQEAGSADYGGMTAPEAITMLAGRIKALGDGLKDGYALWQELQQFANEDIGDWP